jgi:hypothetical protein
MRSLLSISVLVLLLFVSCFYDVHDDPAAFEEAHSVWQYLSVFSIHQDRVPPSAGNLTPEEMFEIIDDRHYGSRYTGYLGDGSGGGGLPSGEPIDTPVVVMPGTVYFHIPDFLDKSLGSFERFVMYLGGFENIIIDLRFNLGGYTYAAERMLGEILPRGAEYIEYNRRAYDRVNRRGYMITGERLRTQDRHTPALLGKNIIVLMNEFSASSSEIMIAGLKDGGADALLIGGQTYGKGIGQMLITRPGKRMLSVTHMRINGLSPRTGSFNEVGIEPDEVREDIFNAADEAAARWADLTDPGNAAYNEMIRLRNIGDVEGLRRAIREEEAIISAYYDMLSDAHNSYASMIAAMWLNVLAANDIPNVPWLRRMLHEEFRDLYCALKLINPDYEPPMPPEAISLGKAAGQKIRTAVPPVRAGHALRLAYEGRFKPIGAIEVTDELLE